MRVTALDDWLAALENRHLSDLTFAEVSRALRALSSTYVERRSKLADGAALSGAGKRAAFALFYGPLHFLLLEHIARSLSVGPRSLRRSSTSDAEPVRPARRSPWRRPRRRSADRLKPSWALDEAVITHRQFGLRSSVRRGDVSTRPLAG